MAPHSLNNASDGSNDGSDDGSNVAADGSNVAANESNDVPDRYYDVPGSSNNAADGFDDHVPTSLLTFSALGADMDESVTALKCTYPPSLSEDTDTTTTSLSGP